MKNNDSRRVRSSNGLGDHLRHQPQRCGVELVTGGRRRVDPLLAAHARNDFPEGRTEAETIFAVNDEQRLSFDERGARIHANQVQSMAVDQGPEPQVPPEWLYHGTGEQAVTAIEQTGILKMNLLHVHLTLDIDVATTMGERHGPPVVLGVAAAAMHRDGHFFLRSANGVWLVEFVPPEYVRRW